MGAQAWLGSASMVAVAIAITGGCEKDIEKPTPPDMTSLVAAYQSPDGIFEDAAVNDVLSAVDDVLSTLVELGLDERLEELLTQFREATAEEPEAETQQSDVDTDNGTVRVEGEGFLELTRICNGWGPEPVADEANGTLKLNVNVTDLRVDPVIWLTASDCRYREGDVPILLGAGSRRDVGDLRIFVGDNLGVGDVGTDPMIIDVDVTAGVDPDGGGSTEGVDFDIKLDPTNELVEIRVPLASGDVIVGTSASVIVQVRAVNGSFGCAMGICVNEAGDEVAL